MRSPSCNHDNRAERRFSVGCARGKIPVRIAGDLDMYFVNRARRRTDAR